MRCWELRGCHDDKEMFERCPHNTPGEPCPADCHFAACRRPCHVVAQDFALLLQPDLDYDAGIKEICHFCEFFLSRGPKLSTSADIGLAPNILGCAEASVFCEAPAGTSQTSDAGPQPGAERPKRKGNPNRFLL